MSARHFHPVVEKQLDDQRSFLAQTDQIRFTQALESRILTNQTAYFLLAIDFTLLLNLMVFILLRVNYRSANKAYSQWPGIAAKIEALMQIPSVMLSISPKSLPTKNQCGLVFQSTSAWYC